MYIQGTLHGINQYMSDTNMTEETSLKQEKEIEKEICS